MSEAEVCCGDPFSCGDGAQTQTSWTHSILVWFSREGVGFTMALTVDLLAGHTVFLLRLLGALPTALADI